MYTYIYISYSPTPCTLNLLRLRCFSACLAAWSPETKVPKSYGLLDMGGLKFNSAVPCLGIHMV